MEFVIRFALLLIVLLLISKLYWSLRHRWRRNHATDIELFWIFPADSDHDMRELTVGVPNFNSWFWCASRTDKPDSSDSEHALSETVSELLAEYQLVQIVIANQFLPDRSYIYDHGIRPFQDNVKYVDRALLYSPDAIASGALRAGIAKGVNVFLIFREDHDNVLSEIREVESKQKDRSSEETIGLFLSQFDIEGFIVQDGEHWQFAHRDPSFRERLLHRIINSMHRRLFVINQLELPEPVEFPPFEKLVPEQFRAPGTMTYAQVYFEEGTLVTYFSSHKKWASVITEFSATVTPQILGLSASWIRRWLIPQVVPDRAYCRKSLFRFSAQYLCACFYMLGLIALIIFLSETVFSAVSDIWFQIPSIILGFLMILSLILSMSYLVRAVFGGRRLLRPGI